MPLDFPSSPINGQVYEQYVYDSALPGWRSKGGAVAATYTSDTAPSGAVKGDMWYRTSDGTTYVYVVDGDTSQWVEIRSEISTSKVGLIPVKPASITVGSGSGSVAADGTITFSNSSSLSVDGVFTSSFRNYRIVMTRMVANTASSLQGRFRANGSTLSSGVYYTAAMYQRADAVSGTYSGFNGIGYSELAPITVENGWTAVTWDVFQPAISDTHTTSFFQSTGYSTAVQNRNGSIMYNGQAALDGFHINSNVATNISGIIKVYGYN